MEQIAGTIPVMVRTLEWYDIRSSPHGVGEPSGIYIWYERDHGIDTAIYVGQSIHLYTRIRQHISTDSVVGEYIDRRKFERWQERRSDTWEPCEKYPHDCNCVPHFWVKLLIFTQRDIFTLHDQLDDVERQIIQSLDPVLNTVRQKPNRIWRSRPVRIQRRKHD